MEKETRKVRHGKWKAIVISVILLGMSLLLGYRIFWYSGSDLPSGFLTENQERIANEKRFPEKIMLTYGPYHTLRSGSYLLGMHYAASEKGNEYRVYTDIGASVLETGALEESKTWAFAWVNHPGVQIQMLSYYGAEGELQIKGAFVIPVWLLAAAGICLLFLFTELCLKLFWKKMPSIVRDVFPLPTIFLWCSTCFFVDDSAFTAKYSFFTAAWIIGGILIACLSLFDRIGKRELTFLSGFAACLFTEWHNLVNYEYDWRTFYFTAAGMFLIFLFLWRICKKERSFTISTAAVVIVFCVYSMAQYMYYLYFRDFFNIKIIKMLFTAMEATASIQALFTREVLLYPVIAGSYLLIMAALLVVYKITSAKKA